MFLDSEHSQIQALKEQDESDMGTVVGFSRVALLVCLKWRYIL
jgi:hypothetical protein